LRGGNNKPNYDSDSIDHACEQLEQNELRPQVMVDCSHANSNKDYRRQADVCRDIAKQIRAGQTRIIGIMMESNLVEGRQDVIPGQKLTYGQSVTDACIAWETTEGLLQELAEAVRQRRQLASQKASA
jgi:3-deoxy-7-phosphoheptulonate synthase